MADTSIQANQSQPKQPIIEKAAYTKREAGELSGTSESTIHRAIKKGQLKAAFIGRRVVIRGAALLQWLQECEEGRLA